jgi:hypothetical protein
VLLVRFSFSFRFLCKVFFGLLFDFESFFALAIVLSIGRRITASDYPVWYPQTLPIVILLYVMCWYILFYIL